MSIGDKLLKSAAAGGLTPSENFKAITYSGNGTAGRAFTVGFQPDYIVIKMTSGSDNWRALDTTRGLGFVNYWNLSNAQDGSASPVYLTVSSTGFATTSNGNDNFNASGSDYVAYCWKANGGTTSTNSEGSEDSTVQANAAAGFSIIKYTGTGSGATIGHGLDSAPKFIISKRIDSSSDWLGGAVDWTKYLEPNGTPPFRTANVWGNTAPTDSVYSVINSTSASGVDYIVYAFADVAGYQKIGTYTGNGSANGPIVETDFEVGFVWIKNLDSTNDWQIFDNGRNTSNPRTEAISPSSSGGDWTNSGYKVDFLSNGFQIIGDGSGINESGDSILYIAIATDPDTEAPTLADSFNVKTWTGDGSARNIDLGFQPNFAWIKSRSYARNHYLYDSIRGADNQLVSNTTDAQANNSQRLTAFNTDSFSLGTSDEVNKSAETYVAWAWKANDDVPTINDNGSIDSIVSVNANAGFSIVKYHGDSASSATIGHGLSSAPELIITKALNFAGGWPTQIGGYYGLRLNSTGANDTANGSVFYGNTAPTATVFTVGGSDEVNDDYDYISYCFHSVAGYSKFGTYTGDGGDGTGPTVTTGFKPDFVMVKRSSGTGNWQIYDTRRNDKLLFPNDSAAEQNLVYVDFLSTGFKPIAPSSATGDTNINLNGSTYIYAAFKKNVASNTTLANSFKAVTYTGNSTNDFGTTLTQSVTGVGFKPDLVWIKNRNHTYTHALFDSVRGATNQIQSNSNAAQSSSDGYLKSFDSDGFGLGGDYAFNRNAYTYVAWCWKAGQTWQHNIDGTIASTVNVNTANGFSIVKYTATGTTATVGHGLSSAPEFIMAKVTNQAYGWVCYHTSLGSSKVIYLSTNDAAGDSTSLMNATDPTSSVFTAGASNNLNYADGNEIIAYCFHSVAGYSKFGTYNGSGSDGNAVSLGFQPDFVMIKRTNDTGGWLMFDSARNTSNPRNNRLEADSNAGATTGSATKNVDFNATDFEANGSDTEVNASGSTYIYMAFKIN